MAVANDHPVLLVVLGQMVAQSSSGPSKKAMTFYMLIAFVIGGIMLSSIVQSQCIS